MIVKHLDSPPLDTLEHSLLIMEWLGFHILDYFYIELENCPTYQDSPRINFKSKNQSRQTFALHFKFALKIYVRNATFNSTHRSAIKYPNKIMCTERELWM